MKQLMGYIQVECNGKPWDDSRFAVMTKDECIKEAKIDLSVYKKKSKFRPVYREVRS